MEEREVLGKDMMGNPIYKGSFVALARMWGRSSCELYVMKVDGYTSKWGGCVLCTGIEYDRPHTKRMDAYGNKSVVIDESILDERHRCVIIEGKDWVEPKKC